MERDPVKGEMNVGNCVGEGESTVSLKSLPLVPGHLLKPEASVPTCRHIHTISGVWRCFWATRRDGGPSHASQLGLICGSVTACIHGDGLTCPVGFFGNS